MSLRIREPVQAKVMAALLACLFLCLPLSLSAANLSGIVKDHRGQAIEGATVSLFQVENSRFRQVGNTIRVGADGAYEWTVSPGSYVLRSSVYASDVSLAGAPEQTLISSADFVVNGDTIHDTLYDFVVLTGRVLDTNNAPIENVEITTSMLWHGPEKGVQQQLSQRSLNHAEGSVRTDAQGNYIMLLFASDLCVASGFYEDKSNCFYDIRFTPPAESGFDSALRADFEINQSQNLGQTLSLVDRVNPKIIAGPYVKNITDHSVELEWQTDEPVTSTLQVVGREMLSFNQWLTQHSVVLKALDPATEYSVQLNTADKQNNPSTPVNISFTTAASHSDVQAPQFVQLPRLISLTETQMSLAFCASEPVTGKFVIEGVDYALSDAARCHELTVAELLPNQPYSVSAEITDIAGNGPTQSPVTEVLTLAAADLTPPLIVSGPVISDVSDTTALVRWTTNEPASSSVSFNDGTHYRVQNDPALITEHVVQITGLTASTAYELSAVSTDGSGNFSLPSQAAGFVTQAAPDATAPFIIGRALATDISSSNAMISWQTDESASTVVYLGETAEALSRVETAPGFRSQHQLLVTQLAPDTSYYYQVESSDLAGNKASGSVYSFQTRSANETSELEITAQPVLEKLTGNSITLSWKTNLIADSRMRCESANGIKEVNKVQFTKQHVLTLIGLDFNTAYRCAVYSTNVAGKIASSVIGAFTTGEIDSTPPGCSASTTAQGFVRFAEVSWQADELAYGMVSYRVKGQSDWLQTPTSSLSESGFQRLSGLSADTTYEYQVSLTDTVGNTASCALGEFTTGSEANPPVVPEPVFSTQPFITNIDQSSATVNWSTELVSSGNVRFGLTENSLSKLEADPEFKLSHELVLASLQAETTYFLQVDALNSQGLETTSNIVRFTTAPVPTVEVTPPRIIAGPFVKNISDSTAVIEWQTDKAGTSQVSVAGGATFSNSDLTTTHAVILSGLRANTDYATSVTSIDSQGLSAVALPANFRTLTVPDSALPHFLISPTVLSVDYDNFTLWFCANEPVTGSIRVDTIDSDVSESIALDKAALCHQFTVSSRTPRTRYLVTVAITDVAGNGPLPSTALTVTTRLELDISAPLINGPVVTDISESTAIVRWTTNEASNSGLAYTDGRSINRLSEAALVTEHVMYLNGLSASTKYTLFASSSDAAGNGPSISAPVEFTTLAKPDSQAPVIISGPFVENISSDSADIVWSTNESASHRVLWGLSEQSLDQQVDLTGYTTKHRLSLAELTAETRYYFRVESADLAGNQVNSDVRSFTTLAPEVIPPALKITAGPDIEQVTLDSLTVSWETNLDADSRLVCEAEQSSQTTLLSSYSSYSSASETLAPFYSVSSSQAIEGQYIVLLKEPDDQQILYSASANTASQTGPGAKYFGLSRKQSAEQRRASVKALAGDIAEKVKGRVSRHYSNLAPGFVMRMQASSVHDLRQDPRVLLIEQDQVIRVNETQSGATWGLDRIDQADLPLNSNYQYALDGSGVNAYILDTGILTSHTDFAGRAVHGWDFIDNDANATDCNGHGTHVAGTVGGSTWGVAKNVTLHAIRVLDCNGSGTSSGVLAGVDWVTANAKFPAVANMSLGGGNSVALDEAVNRGINAGITFAVAAGNSNIDACSGSPNKVPAAITVASSTSNDSRSSFSNWGSCVDLFAPGSDITSTWHTGGTNTISGTSMATPHVAGAVALYLQAHPEASPAEVAASLKSYATRDKIRGLNGSPNLLLNIEFDGQTEQPAPPPAPPAEKITFEVSDPERVTFHQLTLTGLSANTTYSCQVSSSASDGQQVSATLRGTTLAVPDTEPPECSGETEATAYVDSAKISWASNELTTAVVHYRPVNSEDWLQSGSLQLAKQDSLLLTGLLEQTEYEQQVTLSDAAGNQTQCAAGYFTTVAAEAIPAPMFTVQPVVSNITEYSATISWETQAPSSGLVLYGKTISNLTEQKSANSLASTHSLTLHNLNANTLYYLQVDAFNILGEKTSSDTVNFSTLHMDRDFDNDGLENEVDNCPLIANPDQLDSDNDGAGDACDPPAVIDNDFDKDGVLNDLDNCPVTANPDQQDSDNNGIGDDCDIPQVIIPDSDEDGVPDSSDNCPLAPNADQADTNSNGIGDACDAPPESDSDYDNDGVLDDVDNCPQTPNADQQDSNGNGIGDVCDAPTVVMPDYDDDGIADDNDNCPRIFNPDQADSNSNGIGDVCDAPVVSDNDYDDDGVLDDIDNCPTLPNADQLDRNNNGVGDVCDIPAVIENDYDRDGIMDEADNCPLIPNPDQADRDSNGIGDACDLPPEVLPPEEKPVGIKLSGVVNAEGAPVSGAQVALYSQQKRFLRAVTTTSEGAYLFEKVRAGDYFIGVTPSLEMGLSSPPLQAVKVADRDVVHLVTLIADAHILSGFLRDSQGRVIDQVQLSLHQQSTGQQVGNPVRTNEYGYFEFAVAPGTYKLRPLIDVFNPANMQADGKPIIPSYRVPDYAAVLHAPQDIKVMADTELDVTLPFALLSGRTFDGQGNLVAGVGLLIRHKFSSTTQDYYLENYARHDLSHAISDENGHFEFALFTDQEVDILLTPPDNRPDLAVTTIAGYSLAADASEDFTLVEGISLSGRLLDTQGRPIDYTKVSLHRQDSDAQVGQAVYTDAAGVYRFQVEQGTYKIKPHLNPFGLGEGQRPSYPLPDYASVLYAEEEVFVDGATVQDVVLPMAILSGRTIDANGSPIANTRVTISHIAELAEANRNTGYYLESQGSSLVTHALTNANGEFSLALFTDQAMDLTLVPPLSNKVVSATLIRDYVLTEDKTETFVMSQPFILSGILKDKQQRPLDHTLITVHHQSNRQLADDPVLTDANGYFEFRLAEGQYQLRPYLQTENQVNGQVLSPNYPVPDFAAVYYQPKNIRVYGNTFVNVTLPMSVLSGKALDANGVMVPGVKLRVDHAYTANSLSYYLENSGDRLNSNAITASDGRFAFGLFTGQKTDISMMPPEGSGFAVTNVSHTINQETSEDIWLVHHNFAAAKIISVPVVKKITANSAVVEWLTDKPASSVVQLSNGQRYDNTALTTQHSVVLTGLNSETVYQADVHSVDKDDNATQTLRTSFTTQGTLDYRAPLILEGPFASNISHHQFTLRLCADEPVTGHIKLDDNAFELTELALCHERVLDGLTPNMAYNVKPELWDASGNGPTVSPSLVITTLAAPDVEAPVIQAMPMVIDISDTSATVTWTTDEAATSGVSYHDGQEYHVVSDPQYVKEHAMTLVDLSPETHYTLSVSSTDREGNGPSTSLPISFRTLASPDTRAPIIIGNPLIQHVTHESAVIRWQTDEPASTRVLIGTSADALNQSETSNGLTMRHNLPVSGLQADTIYYFQVQTADAHGNEALSELMSFRTKARGHQANQNLMSEVDIVELTSNRLSVLWQTDINADARLVCVSASETLEVSQAKRTKQHRLTLTGLVAGRSYECTAYSSDHHGNTEAKPLESSIVVSNGQLRSNAFSVHNMSPANGTAPVTTQAPVVESYGEVATLRLVTNELSVAFVEYQLAGSDTWQAVGTQEQNLKHLLLLTDLTPGSTYQLRYVLADIEGHQSQAQTLQFNSGRLSDLELPVISSQPIVSEISASSAVISWANARSLYGQVSFGRSISELLDKEAHSEAQLNSSVKLVNLAPATIYYAQVTAFNLLGESVSSEIVRFVTSASSDSADSDHDGMPDVWEIQHELDPQNSADASLDADTDGLSNLEEYQAQTDPARADSDSDGIPDGWEVDHGLNPNNAADATADADNNGVSNLNEYLSTTDKEAPVINLISSITLDARGPLTAVPTSNISATDNIDGVVNVVNLGQAHLPPGRHTINWLAEDRAGNRTMATQTIHVNPQVLLSKAHITGEGNLVKVSVSLSGNAPAYPVRIPFTISGTASTDDYSISGESNVSEDTTYLAGTIIIEEGLHADLLMQTHEDQLAENDEQIIITFNNPVNAVLGSNSQHQVTITEANIAPVVSLSAEQNSIPVTTVSALGGVVTIEVQIEDANFNDTHMIDWSATDNSLVDTDGDPMTLSFNSAGVAPVIYKVAVTVSDDGLPAQSASAYLNLKVVQAYPLLSASLDSDDDGVTDLVEGYQDADLDGIPDYLDDLEGAHWLQVQPASQDHQDYLMQVEHGVLLALGELALSDAQGGALVNSTTFRNSELYRQFGDDTGYESVGGMFDFEIRNVTPASSVSLVIPLQEAIPANAIYRKLHPELGWQNFVVDTHNQLYSASGEAGVCPAPGDAAYQRGLTQGHYCMMMYIEDGGANDADGEANGTIVDPGSVSRQIATEVTSPDSSSTTSSGGGGGGSVFWLLWIALLLGQRRIHLSARKQM